MRSPNPLLSLAVAVGLALLAPNADAQNDFTVRRIFVDQIVTSPTLQMIAGRTTMVRALIAPVPSGADPVELDGVMRIYVDGKESPDSPVFSDNGPLLVTDTVGGLGTEDSTLNFFFIAPASDDVVLEVQLNPFGPNFVPESDINNNTSASSPQSFQEQGVLQLAYAPIDYRPSGGATPNPPDPDLIKPGVGDNFVQAIFPGGLIDYRRIDAPSKLWTSSLSGSGFSLNNSLASDLALMSPQPDFIYGWVPGSLPYNGQALLPGVASMGNTQPIRHQRTYAHELGHNYNQFHNSTTTGLIGIDVERHLNLTEALPLIKPTSQRDIMWPGLLTPQAWIANGTYNALRNHPSFDDPAPVTAADPKLLVSGTWNRETGSLSLEHVVEVPGGRATPVAGPGQADLVVRAFAGGELARQMAFPVRTSEDVCGGCAAPLPADDGDEAAHEHDAAGDTAAPRALAEVLEFTLVLPARAADGRALDELEFLGAGTHPVQTTRRARSEHAPEGRFLTPVAGASAGSEVLVSWAASDADGDAVSATLRYSPDGAEHYVPLLVRSDATELLVDLAELPHFRAGAGHFELLLSDGLRTTRVVSPALEGPGAYAGVGGALPWVEIYHPDDGFSFREGANVVLHSSGWDLEDFSLNGSEISWSSDVDGPLGEGRRLVVNDLSVGAHQITVTATDSGGQQSTATNGVTITARPLPDVGTIICSSDIGFGGPGSSSLSLCGEIASGGTSTLLLADAPAFTTAYLIVGVNILTQPLKGGILAPSPDVVLIRQTDGDGVVEIQGVTVPSTIYAQYVVVDPGQALGHGFSNAIFVELP